MSALPVALSFVTNVSKATNPLGSGPECTGWNEPAVVGKFTDRVGPNTNALPAASTLMREPNSTTLPPRYVEYTIAEAVGLIFVTKASNSPLLVRSNALALVGKSVDPVDPVT